MSYRDEDDDESFDDEGFEPDEFETEGDASGEFDDDDTIPCPYCREPIHEDAQRCPHCGEYISREDVPATMKPWWILVGAAAGLYAMYRLIAG